MSRRGSGGLVEAVLGIGAKVPWPAAAALAVVFFGIFRWLSNIDAPDPAATTIATIAPVLPRTVVRTVAALLQYVVPALLLVGAAISAIRESAPARVAFIGRRRGRQRDPRSFWGCSRYPACKGTREG
jgi:hypothetical protein